MTTNNAAGGWHALRDEGRGWVQARLATPIAALWACHTTRAAVEETFPGIEWSDEQRGFVESGEFDIELKMEEGDPVGHVIVWVRGANESKPTGKKRGTGLTG